MAERVAKGKGKRVNDPEGMRRRVLDVAAEAFQSRGYHATSMHDIVRAAETTGGALHHHFPTKKDLGLAVLNERVARAVETTWIVPVRCARDAAEGILSVFERIAAELNQRGAVTGCPLNNLALELSLADPDFRLAAQGIFANWRMAIADKFRADERAGTLKDADPDALATLVVSSYSGAMALAKADQHARALEACAAQLARIMQPARSVPAKPAPKKRRASSSAGR